MKQILVLGGGGFIGGHLAKRLKSEGNYIRIVDLKRHEYFEEKEICDDFVVGDLTDARLVNKSFFAPKQNSILDRENSFDEVYQLAADMGGAGYIFTGQNDANVMHNSSLINLNVLVGTLTTLNPNSVNLGRSADVLNVLSPMFVGD